MPSCWSRRTPAASPFTRSRLGRRPLRHHSAPGRQCPHDVRGRLGPLRVESGPVCRAARVSAFMDFLDARCSLAGIGIDIWLRSAFRVTRRGLQCGGAAQIAGDLDRVSKRVLGVFAFLTNWAKLAQLVDPVRRVSAAGLPHDHAVRGLSDRLGGEPAAGLGGASGHLFRVARLREGLAPRVGHGRPAL